MLYHLYYFSATGNTAHSAEMIAAALRNQGHKVGILSINRWAQPLEGNPDRLVLSFATLSFRPPSLVSRFLKKLRGKTADGAPVPAAVLAVAGGGSWGAEDVAAGKLEHRGYRVTLSSSANYTDNWIQVVSPPEGDERDRKNAAGIAMTGVFIAELLKDPGPERSHSGPVWTRFGRGLGGFIGAAFSLIGRRLMGKMFIADAKCNSCRLCEQRCPVGAIVMSKSPTARPYWNLNCESCNRCMNICPKKAINSSIPGIVILMSAIVLSSAVGVILYARLVHPLYSGGMIWPRLLLDFAGYSLVVLFAHTLFPTLVDIAILHPLQRWRLTAGFMERSYSLNFSRYAFKGFKPPKENPAP